MEPPSISHILLPESEFYALIKDETAALAVDMSTGLIVYATERAEDIFHCGMKNGLRDMPYERLIPSELREKHIKHVAVEMKNPQPRRMGATKRIFPALTLDGQRFDAVITLKPVKKKDRVYQIVIFTVLPKEANAS